MNRRVGVALLFVVAIAGLGVVTAVPDAQLRISDVDVDPGTPVAGEPVTLSPTIESSAGSDEAVDIDTVTATVDGEEIGSQTNVGSLSPGESLSVPVTTTFDEPGEYTITFTVEGTDEDGDEVTVTRQETVTVSPVPDVRLTVDDVDVQPATPTAGAPVTVPVSVDSSGGSNQPVDVDRVLLQNETGTLVAADDLGSLSIGDGLTVPLTTTFETPGAKNLTVVFEGTNANDELVRASQPVTVAVEPGAPAIDTRTRPAIEGVASPVTVVVGNPTEATLRNVAVTVDAEGVEPIVDRRVIPALQAGATANLSFDVRPVAIGETLVETNVSYTTAAGTAASTQDRSLLSIDQLDEDVSVRVSTVEPQQESTQPDLTTGVEGFLDTGGDQQQEQNNEGDLTVTVSNLGNAPITDVVLDPRAGSQSLGPRPVAGTIAPNGEESVQISLERTPPEEIVFEASYAVADEESTAETSFDPLPSRGRVAVTGVDIEADGEDLEITGDIGNPGDSEVSGVVVRVAESETVTPALGGQDFFVGAIESNSFAPFELAAAADENATAVTLEVEYLVAGDQRSETLAVPLDTVSRESGDDGLPVLLIGGVAVLVVAVVTITIVIVRRS